MSGHMRVERRGECAGGGAASPPTLARSLRAADAAEEARVVGDTGRLASKLCNGGSWVGSRPSAALSGEGKHRAWAGAAARVRCLLVGLRHGECVRSRCPLLRWSSVRLSDAGGTVRTHVSGMRTRDVALPGDRRDMFPHLGSGGPMRLTVGCEGCLCGINTFTYARNASIRS